jgi:uncharacterized protein (TIGR03435 family)
MLDVHPPPYVPRSQVAIQTLKTIDLPAAVAYDPRMNQSKRFCISRIILAASWIALAPPLIHAQPSASSQASPSPSPAPPAPLTFDAVSIKQNKSQSMGGSGRSTPDGETLVNQSLVGEISFAYGVASDDVIGLPSWVRDNRYDIQYKVAPEDIPAYHKLHGADRLRMRQAVLEDRLKLKAHLGSKEVPMYQLVIAKGGPKLHEAKPGDTYADGLKLPDGTPMAGSGIMAGRGTLVGQQVPVSALLNSLKGATGRPVLDKTGLTGKYDISLHWSPDLGAASPDSAPADDAGLSIYTALEDQLGLKLEPTKGTVPTLIIDHIEPPTEN